MGVSALELRRRVLMAQPHKERKTGGIVSFNTNVPQVLDVSVPLSPVQAGTGDPYPPGGGINLINVADRTVNLNNLYYVDVPLGFSPVAGETYTFSVEVTTTEEPFNVSIGCGTVAYMRDMASANGNSSGRVTLTFTPTEAQLEGRPNLFVRAPRYGTPRTATAEVKNYQLEKGATAHDFAPYSNIRPITGWTGATAYRTGKNLLDVNAMRPGNFATSVNFPSGNVSSAEYVPLRPGKYTWSQLPYGVSGGIYVRFYNANKEQIGNVSIYSDNPYTITAPEDTCYCRFMLYRSTNQFTSLDDVLALKPMVEVGETASEYAPYSGESFPFTFPDTVYGGRLEPAAGRVVVDRAKKTFNGSESWGVYAHATYGNTFRVPIVGKLIAVGLSICDAFTNISDCWESNGRGRHGVFSDHTTTNSLYFRAPNASVDDLAAWTAWLSENPVTVVYYLATPVEIPLTPAEIRALMGENNVFSDAVDVEVEFWTN